MQAIVPYFVQRGQGHLINISSFLGRVPLATFRSAYSAAKAALASLTTSLRMDLAREHPGVHVSLVMPGVVKTEFASNALGDAPPPMSMPPGAPQPQTAEEAAAAIVRLVEHPAPEIYTNPALAGVARRHFEELNAFGAPEPAGAARS
jgi:short-subunit dehydrogenase